MWLEHFRKVDYSKTKNRKASIDMCSYRVTMSDEKNKEWFDLMKSRQKGETSVSGACDRTVRSEYSSRTK